MSSQEKMFYTLSDSCEYLGIDTYKLITTTYLLSIDIRASAGMNGVFISKQDVDTIKQYLENPTAYI